MNSILAPCPKCGQPVAADAPGGLCPRCLVAGALSDPQPQPDPAPGSNADSDSDSTATLRIVIAEDAPLPHAAPRRLGKYELLEAIARGGMGIVYQARHTGLDAIVAVKLIRSGVLATPTDVERFRREARTAAKLQHPNIVSIHDIGEQDGQHYFAMDYVPGANLAELARARPFEAKAAAGIVALLARAIHYAHGQGVLHRDLKPANVILTPDQQPHVLDFGLARVMAEDSRLTQSGAPMGSPCYMPPEQCGIGSSRREEAHSEKPAIRNPQSAMGQSLVTSAATRGRIGPWSDVYGLGAVLYELLTGRPPYQAPTVMETMRLVVESEAVLPRLFNRLLAVDLETICLKCLEKEPAKRYGTAQELAEDLDRFVADEPIRARRITQAERTWRWCKRNSRVASFGAVSCVLLLALAIGGPMAAYRINEARLEAEQHLYASDMNVAQRALEDSNVGRAVEHLNRHRPTAGQKDVRGWEWHYLWARCQSDAQFTLPQQSGGVRSLAFSGDGAQLVIPNLKGGVALWDAVRWQLVTNLLQHGQWRSAAFAPDSDLLAVGGAEADPDGLVREWSTTNGVVHLWEVSTGRHLARLQHASYVRAVAFAPRGRQLAALCDEGNVLIWQLEPFEIIRRIRVPERKVQNAGELRFSPEGGLLAIGASDGTLRLLETREWREQLTIRAHASRISALSFSRDGRTLASGSMADQEVRLWEARSGQSAGALKGHDSFVTAVAFSPDGRTLFSAAADQRLHVWDLATLQLRAALRGHRNEIHSLALSSDGTRLVTGGKDGEMCVWDPGARPRYPEYRTLPERCWSFAFLQDSKRLAMRTVRGGLSIWELAPPRLILELAELGTNHQALDVSADGRFLGFGEATGHVGLYDLHTGRLRWRRPSHSTNVPWLQFVPNANAIACMARDKTFKLLDLATGQEHASWRFAERVWAWAAPEVAPSGRTLAVGNADGTLSLYVVATGQERVLPVRQAGDITRVAFAPDETLVASTCLDGTSCLIGLRPVREITRTRVALNALGSLAFSPGGDRIAFGGDAVRLFDLRSFRQVMALGHPEQGHFGGG